MIRGALAGRLHVHWADFLPERVMARGSRLRRFVPPRSGGRTRNADQVCLGPPTLTLASPEVNRFQKSGKEAGDWLPNKNRCWFAGRVVDVKRAYDLTV